MTDNLSQLLMPDQRPDYFVSPHYESPPVYETALTVQFKNLEAFGSVHFGRFHQLIAADYPVARDQHRLDPIAERFPWTRPQPGIRFAPGVQVNRAWFLEAGAEPSKLVQLQPDRLSFNWKRKNDEAEYPRFSANLPRFLGVYEQFLGFCEVEELGEVKPDIFEVVYVNRFQKQDDETSTQLVCSMFDCDSLRETPLGMPESIALNRTYEVPRERGRLYLEVTSSEAEVVMKVTCRILREKSESIADGITLAHDWVVNGFAASLSNDFERERLGRIK